MSENVIEKPTKKKNKALKIIKPICTILYNILLFTLFWGVVVAWYVIKLPFVIIFGGEWLPSSSGGSIDYDRQAPKGRTTRF